MHDNFVLVQCWIGGFLDDVVQNSLIGCSSVKKAKPIKRSSVRVVIYPIPSVILR
jgi:hypothetical protein